jgi:hypothetical protein
MVMIFMMVDGWMVLFWFEKTGSGLQNRNRSVRPFDCKSPIFLWNGESGIRFWVVWICEKRLDAMSLAFVESSGQSSLVLIPLRR